jgi:hypothetical protein
MDDREWLTERFQHQPIACARRRAPDARLVAEADDALQDAWRIHDQDAGSIDNVQAWLTTVVGRVCPNILCSRRVRSEGLSGVHVPDPVVMRSDVSSPEQEALLALVRPNPISDMRERSSAMSDEETPRRRAPRTPRPEIPLPGASLRHRRARRMTPRITQNSTPLEVAGVRNSTVAPSTALHHTMLRGDRFRFLQVPGMRPCWNVAADFVFAIEGRN